MYRSTTSLTAMDAIAGRFPGGRPLRRRREMVLMLATGGSEETAGLQEPMAEAAERQRLRRAAIFE